MTTDDGIISRAVDALQDRAEKESAERPAVASGVRDRVRRSPPLSKPVDADVEDLTGASTFRQLDTLVVSDRVVVDAGEHLDAGPDPLDPRCADEDPVHLAHPDDIEVGLEGVDLPAEGVAPHRHVEAAEQRLPGSATAHLVGQQNHPGAGAVRRETALQVGTQRLQQLEHGE